jgi:hypothetical protein
MKQKLIAASFLVAIVFGYWAYRVKPWISEYKIETTVESFYIHSFRTRPVNKINGYYYIALDMPGGSYPPETQNVYRYVASGKVVHIVLTDTKPRYVFTISTYQNDYLLVRLKSKSEVIEFMNIFNYPYEKYSKYL